MGCNEEKCETTPKETGCEMTDMMMCLADEAWKQLMIEKMKAEFEKARGEKMSRVAAASIEASIAKWEHKMAGKQKCQQAKESLKAAFMG